MDLRRILVFFILIFFMLNINVFSSSIFDVENITHLPDDIEGRPYIIGYSHYSKRIFMCVYFGNNDIKSLHITENGVCDESGNLLTMNFRGYKSDTNEWENYSSYDKYSSWFTEPGLIPYFSNKDVYHNGKIYLLGKEHHSNLGVLSGLSTSVLFMSILKPFLYLMPFILVFIVLIFAFLKAWNFIKGVF